MTLVLVLVASGFVIGFGIGAMVGRHLTWRRATELLVEHREEMAKLYGCAQLPNPFVAKGQNAGIIR
jgi:hypothetical protein